MALADARAMYPALAVAESDEHADRRLLEAVADWCDRYTPLVGLDAPDGLMLDIAGCAHLFGGEAALARDIVRRLAARGLQARAAVADTPGCAWALAHYGSPVIPGHGRQPANPESILTDGGYGFRVRRFAPSRNDGEGIIVPSGRMREFLAPLPLAALRLDPEVVAALAETGLKRVADVLDLPRAVLAARFDGLVPRLDQALGRADEPITPRRPLPSYVAEQRFPEPIAREADVLGTIARLAARLGGALEERQEGARMLETALFRADGKVFRIEVGTGAPLRDPVRIARLFADRLARVGEACDPGFGYDLVRLSALATERCDPVQTGLTTPHEDAELVHLIDRLGARFGVRRVTRLVPQDTHIPEFAIAALPAHAVKVMHASNGHLSPTSRSSSSAKADDPVTTAVADRAERRCRSRSHGVLDARFRGHDNGEVEHADPKPDTLLPTRPLRLFVRPEPIEAMAEVPDGPPVRFRWRRVLHEVAAAEGPERIAMEWWRDDEGCALTRDYFRIECRDGFRAWLFREGLFGRETERPRWFLHGMFG